MYRMCMRGENLSRQPKAHHYLMLFRPYYFMPLGFSLMMGCAVYWLKF